MMVVVEFKFHHHIPSKEEEGIPVPPHVILPNNVGLLLVPMTFTSCTSTTVCPMHRLALCRLITATTAPVGHRYGTHVCVCCSQKNHWSPGGALIRTPGAVTLL